MKTKHKTSIDSFVGRSDGLKNEKRERNDAINNLHNIMMGINELPVFLLMLQSFNPSGSSLQFNALLFVFTSSQTQTPAMEDPSIVVDVYIEKTSSSSSWREQKSGHAYLNTV